MLGRAFVRIQFQSQFLFNRSLSHCELRALQESYIYNICIYIYYICGVKPHYAVIIVAHIMSSQKQHGHVESGVLFIELRNSGCNELFHALFHN